MKNYELTIIFSPFLKEGELEEKLGKLVAAIQDEGGIIERQNVLGRKQLPGLAGKERGGQLALVQFLLAPEKLQGIQALVKKDSGILRSLATNKPRGKERPTPSFASRRQEAKPTEEQKEGAESIDKKLEEIFKE